MHLESEREKCRDKMYQMLVQEHHAERSELAHGIMNMIKEYTQHPVTRKVQQHITGKHGALVQTILLVAACTHEPDFLQYMLEQSAVCSSTISEYAITTMPALLENYLNGNVSSEDFVSQSIHAYITL